MGEGSNASYPPSLDCDGQSSSDPVDETSLSFKSLLSVDKSSPKKFLFPVVGALMALPGFVTNKKASSVRSTEYYVGPGKSFEEVNRFIGKNKIVLETLSRGFDLTKESDFNLCYPNSIGPVQFTHMTKLHNHNLKRLNKQFPAFDGDSFDKLICYFQDIREPLLTLESLLVSESCGKLLILNALQPQLRDDQCFNFRSSVIGIIYRQIYDVNLEEIKQKFFNQMDPRMILVEGLHGVGKSFFLFLLSSYFASLPSVFVVYFCLSHRHIEKRTFFRDFLSHLYTSFIRHTVLHGSHADIEIHAKRILEKINKAWDLPPQEMNIGHLDSLIADIDSTICKACNGEPRILFIFDQCEHIIGPESHIVMFSRNLLTFLSDWGDVVFSVSANNNFSDDFSEDEVTRIQFACEMEEEEVKSLVTLYPPKLNQNIKTIMEMTSGIPNLVHKIMTLTPPVNKTTIVVWNGEHMWRSKREFENVTADIANKSLFLVLPGVDPSVRPFANLDDALEAFHNNFVEKEGRDSALRFYDHLGELDKRLQDKENRQHWYMAGLLYAQAESILPGLFRPYYDKDLFFIGQYGILKPVSSSVWTLLESTGLTGELLLKGENKLLGILGNTAKENGMKNRLLKRYQFDYIVAKRAITIPIRRTGSKGTVKFTIPADEYIETRFVSSELSHLLQNNESDCHFLIPALPNYPYYDMNLVSRDDKTGQHFFFRFQITIGDPSLEHVIESIGKSKRLLDHDLEQHLPDGTKIFDILVMPQARMPLLREQAAAMKEDCCYIIFEEMILTAAGCIELKAPDKSESTAMARSHQSSYEETRSAKKTPRDRSNKSKATDALSEKKSAKRAKSINVSPK